MMNNASELKKINDNIEPGQLYYDITFNDIFIPVGPAYHDDFLFRIPTFEFESRRKSYRMFASLVDFLSCWRKVEDK